jgi:hypothetical protein
MDKAGLIQQFVWDQLVADGHPWPTSGNEILSAAPYHYNTALMLPFLKLIAEKLQDNNPSYYFNYGALDLNTAVADSVNDLCGDIGDQTNLAG